MITTREERRNFFQSDMWQDIAEVLNDDLSGHKLLLETVDPANTVQIAGTQACIRVIQDMLNLETAMNERQAIAESENASYVA